MAGVSPYGLTIIALAAVMSGCASAPERTVTTEQPTPAASRQRPHLLVLDRSLPTMQTWKLIDGQRVNVVPMGYYAPATIASAITVTVEGGNRVSLEMAGSLWSSGGDSNTSAPIVRLLGVAGRPLNWKRVPIRNRPF